MEKKCIVFAFLLTVIFIFSSCIRFNSTYKTPEEIQFQQFVDFMNSNIGILHIDQALERWGTPTSKSEGVNIIVVSWKREFGSTTHLFYSQSGFSTAYNQPDYEELVIVFDQYTKLMKSWKLHN